MDVGKSRKMVAKSKIKKMKIKKKNYIGICVARSGSKGLKNKNLIKIKSKPCAWWTFSEAKKSKLLDRVVCSTDSKEIIKIAKKLKVDVPFIRPKHLSQDNSKIINVITHLLNFYKKKNFVFDYFVLLQCSSPLRKAIDIELAIKKFDSVKNNKNKILVSVTKVSEKYNWILKKNKKKFSFSSKNFNKRRQKMNKLFLPNGAIFIASTKFKKSNFNDSNICLSF